MIIEEKELTEKKERRKKLNKYFSKYFFKRSNGNSNGRWGNKWIVQTNLVNLQKISYIVKLMINGFTGVVTMSDLKKCPRHKTWYGSDCSWCIYGFPDAKLKLRYRILKFLKLWSEPNEWS